MDTKDIIMQSENIRRLEQQRNTIDDEIAILKTQIQDVVFDTFDIKFNSKIQLDLGDGYGPCDYLVLDVYIADGKPTVRVIQLREALNIDHHSDRNPYDDGYADSYGTPVPLDKFTSV